MRKRLLVCHSFAIFVIAILLGLILIACTSASEPTALVIIAGEHSNSKDINFERNDLITNIYVNYGMVRVIVSDGTPDLARNSNGNLVGYSVEFYSDQAKDLYRNNHKLWEQRYLSIQVDNICDDLDEIQPDSPETDMLSSLSKAMDVLGSLSLNSNANKEIIVYDTGLSTTGALSFLDEEWYRLLTSTTRITEADVRPLIDQLEKRAEIPDLSDVEVIWYGLGEVAEPQSELRQICKENLRAIWNEILKCSGATASEQGIEKGYGYFLPSVCVDRIEYEQPVTELFDWYNIDINDSINSDEKLGSLTIYEADLGFVADTAEFLSVEDAMDTLKPYADKLLQYPFISILLVGTTSDPQKNGGSVQLSLDRANKVKQCFVDMGVPEQQILAIGLGAKKPLYDEREWDKDTYVEDFAKRNRAVHLIPADSELALEILQLEETRK